MKPFAFLAESPVKDSILKENNEGGIYNGYVAYPPNSIKVDNTTDCDWLDPLDCVINVHGGITFTGKHSGIEHWPIIPLTAIPDYETIKDWYVIGFDCVHCGDTKELWTFEATKAETLNLLNQVISLMKK